MSVYRTIGPLVNICDRIDANQHQHSCSLRIKQPQFMILLLFVWVLPIIVPSQFKFSYDSSSGLTQFGYFGVTRLRYRKCHCTTFKNYKFTTHSFVVKVSLFRRFKKSKLSFMHLSMFSPRGEWRDSHRELDNFVKLGSSFSPMSRYVVSKMWNRTMYRQSVCL